MNKKIPSHSPFHPHLRDTANHRLCKPACPIQKDNTVTLSTSESEYTGTFILDCSTSPMKLDLTFADLGTIQTVIEFVDENTLRFENNSADIERPTVFSDYATLTREQ